MSFPEILEYKKAINESQNKKKLSINNDAKKLQYFF